jgi:hypothetical protein
MGINRATAKATGRRWPTTIRCHQHIFAVIEPASASYQQPGHHRADDNRRDLDPIPDDLRFRNPAAAVRHMTGIRAEYRAIGLQTLSGNFVANSSATTSTPIVPASTRAITASRCRRRRQMSSDVQALRHQRVPIAR